jgi:transposase
MAHDTIDRPALFLAFAWGAHQWQLGFTTGAAQRPRERHVPARHSEAVREESRTAQERFGLPADAPVISGDEAGRAGCWLHRWRGTQGGDHGVVDSSSLAGKRRHRRAKPDRREGQTWLTMLLRHVAGERPVGRIVRVPRGEAADRRQWHRAFTTATRERTRVINRLKGGLASPGRVMPPGRAVPQPLEHLRRWDGAPLAAGLRHRLHQAWEHMGAWAQRLAQWEAERRAVLQPAEDAVTQQVPPHLRLTGLGIQRAGRCGRGFCGWRAWHHRQEVGALSGLTPPLGEWPQRL